MELWDKQFPTSMIHPFPTLFPDGQVTVEEDLDSCDSTDDETCDSSVASIEISQRDAPILRSISATTRVINFSDPKELIDTGGNFCMCNDLRMLVNVQSITPFGIGMAAVQDKTAPTCTHRGDFPIPMTDGSVYYTPMFYNPQASDCIISPHAICRDSMGYLTRWRQEGSANEPSGSLHIYNKHGDLAISLDLVEKNGLFYTTTETMALDHPSSTAHCSSSSSIYMHTEEGIEDDDISLDWDADSAQTNFSVKALRSHPTKHRATTNRP
jgi:hypothetical protein